MTTDAGNTDRLDFSPSFLALLVLVVIEYGGLANYLPILKTLRLATILGYSLFVLVLFRQAVGDLLNRPQVRILLTLGVMTALSILWAVVSQYALQSIRPLVDYLVFLTILSSLIDRRARIDALSWVFSAVCIFLVVSNSAKLAAGTRVGHFKAAYFMGDGNDFAWGLVVFFPFILNLVLGERSLFARIFGLFAIGCCLMGIVGTGSRGGSIGIAAAVGFYWLLLSRRKVLGAITICSILGIVLLFAPTTYTERMRSVSGYQEDNSAKARLQAWGAAVRMAADHPLGVGAGNFGSAYGRYYRPPEDQGALSWGAGRWLSAHSIYFRILGEYGLPGLVLLISLIWLNIRDNLRAHRTLVAAGKAARISPIWPALLNMSVVGHAVCGIFLGGWASPHIFLLTALTISTSRLAAASQYRPIVTLAHRNARRAVRH